MALSRPAVHPVQPPPPHALEDADAAPFGVLMKNMQGTPGTLDGLGLRLAQASFAAASITAMPPTHVFPSVSAFRYLVAALILQFLWSLALAFVEIYALLVKRSLLNLKAASICSVGDGIAGSLTFSAACASAGVTVLIGSDVDMCVGNPCARFICFGVLYMLLLVPREYVVRFITYDSNSMKLFRSLEGSGDCLQFYRFQNFVVRPKLPRQGSLPLMLAFSGGHGVELGQC